LKLILPIAALAALIGSAALAADTPDTSKAGALPIKLAKLPELTIAKGDVTKGEKAFNTNCSVCHGVAAVGGEGPQLSHTGIKPGQVAFMVRNPAKIDPDSEMPKLDVSDADLADISAYVASLTK
jgi:mono/diheme cytochrome c family protein